MQSPSGGAGRLWVGQGPTEGPSSWIEAGGPELKPEEVFTYLMLNVG